jgi:hypothetical protein
MQQFSEANLARHTLSSTNDAANGGSQWNPLEFLPDLTGFNMTTDVLISTSDVWNNRGYDHDISYYTEYLSLFKSSDWIHHLFMGMADHEYFLGPNRGLLGYACEHTFERVKQELEKDVDASVYILDMVSHLRERSLKAKRLEPVVIASQVETISGYLSSTSTPIGEQRLVYHCTSSMGRHSDRTVSTPSVVPVSASVFPDIDNARTEYIARSHLLCDFASAMYGTRRTSSYVSNGDYRKRLKKYVNQAMVWLASTLPTLDGG